MPQVHVESLDQEGRGVAHHDGKVIFIEGALPGEIVEYSSYRKRANFELAHMSALIHAGSERVAPRCEYFGVCGGCSLQHLDARAQLAAKQRILEDDLAHIGKVSPEYMLPAIQGPAWGYRQRARFSVRYVVKKGGVLVGFHERKSSYVADMRSCEIVPPRVSGLLVPLRELIGTLSVRDRIAQIELAGGDTHDVLVLRNLQPLTPEDEQRIAAFAERYEVRIFLQPRGPDTAHPFHPADSDLPEYALPEFGLTLSFSPTEFTQVNFAINNVLVRRALSLLGPQPGETVGDMFCGIGNFTLAIARSGARVLGVEGSAALLDRARGNAARNGLHARTAFQKADLYEITPEHLRDWGRLDRMLIDPPRDGAVALIKALGDDAPRRIVYVSCSPATLARDAGILAYTKAYRLIAAGVINMFPHTSHVESIALFERQ